MEVAKNCLKKIAMLSVWAGPAAPGYCSGCAWDERRIQMSPATHHMSSMNPCKTHTDEFQQIQSIRSMEVASGQKPVSRKLEKSCNFNFKLKCVNYALYQFTSKLKSKLLIFKPTKVKVAVEVAFLYPC
jgi:hypothetical protein